MSAQHLLRRAHSLYEDNLSPDERHTLSLKAAQRDVDHKAAEVDSLREEVRAAKGQLEKSSLPSHRIVSSSAEDAPTWRQRVPEPEPAHSAVSKLYLGAEEGIPVVSERSSMYMSMPPPPPPSTRSSLGLPGEMPVFPTEPPTSTSAGAARASPPAQSVEEPVDGFFAEWDKFVSQLNCACHGRGIR